MTFAWIAEILKYLAKKIISFPKFFKIFAFYWFLSGLCNTFVTLGVVKYTHIILWRL
jgi:hypothetical protein